jgi:hypothetical protein
VTTLLDDHPWVVILALLLVLALLRALRPRRRTRPSRTRRPAGPTRVHPGETWFALVPFADGTGAKDRPVLVLDVHGGTCWVATLTSQDKGDRRDHVRVPDGWNGLDKPSWIGLDPRALDATAFRRRVPGASRRLLDWYRTQAR